MPVQYRIYFISMLGKKMYLYLHHHRQLAFSSDNKGATIYSEQQADEILTRSNELHKEIYEK